MASDLIAIDQLTEQQIAHILLTLKISVSRFVSWMSATWAVCQSPIARKELVDNINCEVNEDHVAMLDRFVSQSYAFSDQPKISPTLQELISFLTLHTGSALSGLVILGGMEYVSKIGMDWLSQAGKKLKFKDMEYAEVHQVVDNAHYESAVVALLDELRFHHDLDSSFDVPFLLQHLRQFFKNVFNSHLQLAQ